MDLCVLKCLFYVFLDIVFIVKTKKAPFKIIFIKRDFFFDLFLNLFFFTYSFLGLFTSFFTFFTILFEFSTGRVLILQNTSNTSNTSRAKKPRISAGSEALKRTFGARKGDIWCVGGQMLTFVLCITYNNNKKIQIR